MGGAGSEVWLKGGELAIKLKVPVEEGSNTSRFGLGLGASYGLKLNAFKVQST